MVAILSEETVTVQGMDGVFMSSLQQMVQIVKLLHPDFQYREEGGIFSCQLLEAYRIGSIAFKMVLVNIDSDADKSVCQVGSVYDAFQKHSGNFLLLIIDVIGPFDTEPFVDAVQGLGCSKTGYF